MKKKKIFPIVNAGTASILTVFVILAMVAFALLAYMSARRGAVFCRQSVQESQSYEEAKALALEEIASIDHELHQAYEAGTFEHLLEDQTYDFSIPIEGEKALQVTLVPVSPEENEGQLYRVTSFKQVSTGDWEDKSSLNLLDPNALSE